MNRRSFMQMLGLTSALPLVAGFSVKPESSEPSIIELVDSGALGVPKLFPAQRFILKMMYGLELDARERQYLVRLERTGRCTPARQGSQEAVLIVGRRGGMSWLGQTVQLYETLKLLRTQGSEPRGVISVSHDRASAGVHLDVYAACLAESHLQPYLKNRTASYLNFEGEGGGRVRAMFKSAQGKDLRGLRASSVVLDNAAYFQDLPLIHSIVAPCGGRITITTTSDGSKTFRDFYRQAKQRGALTLRIPTQDANPTIPSDFYSRERDHLGLRSFGLEYEARV